MNLDDTQRQRVAKWIEEGLQVSEIQNKLASDLGLRMTYMEVRFLLDDLKLNPRDKEAPSAPAVTLGAKAPQTGAPAAGAGAGVPREDAEAAAEEPMPPSGTGVTVSVDQVTRPGALVSGKVNFSDGQTAEWYLDQFGRLGVVARQQGYKPSQADLMAFQAELQNELARQGF